MRPELFVRLFAVLMALWPGMTAPASYPLEMIPLTLDKQHPRRQIFGELRLMSAYVLKSPIKAFGGISGAQIAPDGSELLAVTDRGRWLHMPLTHDIRTGRLMGINDLDIQPMKRHDRPRSIDAEALSRSHDGDLHVVTIEGSDPSMLFYKVGEGIRGTGTFLPIRLPGVAGGNTGIEAAAFLPDESILIASEARNGAESQGWILRLDADPIPVRFAMRPPYRITDMSFGPDGHLYLLERSISLLGGFGARLRQISPAELNSGLPIRGRELARFGAGTGIDNMEALTIRAAPDNGLLIYMLSDNNFIRLQRTMLLQFHLPAEQAGDSG